MAHKQKFSIGKIIRPDANPDEVENVGAVGNVIQHPIDEERKKELAALMAAGMPGPPAPARDAADDYERILPAGFEEIIPRSKLLSAPDEWNFFGRPSPDQYALIFQSVFKYGLWHPITVWEQSDGRYMILGGHTRNLVYDELYQMTGDETYLSIPCKVYEHDRISETTARRIIILTNIAQRAQENPRLRIRCYCEMARLEKQEAFYGSGIDTNAAVAKLFGVSRATVCFYRKLENLLDDFVDALETNDISRKAATALSDLPRALQQYIFDEGYYFYGFSPARLRQLRQADSRADIDQIFRAPAPAKEHRYTCSAAIEQPAGFDPFPLYIRHDDMDAFKDLLRAAIDGADQISDKTREVVSRMLQ